MKKVAFTLITLVAILTGIIAVPSSPAYAATEEITIEGVVEAAEYNEKDEVTAILIFNGSEEFLVTGSLVQEMMGYINETVKATGSVTTNDDGQKSIKVAKYKLAGE